MFEQAANTIPSQPSVYTCEDDDVRQLIDVVDGGFETYEEIHFNESVNRIASRWPLLNEARSRRTAANQADNSFDVQRSA